MIRPLGIDDINAMVVLRSEALADSPRAFSASPERDVGQDPEFLRRTMSRPEVQVTFGAFESDELVGTATVHRFEGSKERHKAVLWGMYVTSRARGRGHGRALLEAAVEHARASEGVTHLHLTVADSAVEARRLYEGAGFVCWGTEPASLIVDGEAVDVDHLVLGVSGDPYL